MNERDTKFLGFAELLQEELRFLSEEDKRLVIAQRAYDLACHIVEDINYGLDTHTVEDAVDTIPDLTQWPEQSNEQTE